jgi:hypothetical protein
VSLDVGESLLIHIKEIVIKFNNIKTTYINMIKKTYIYFNNVKFENDRNDSVGDDKGI